MDACIQNFPLPENGTTIYANRTLNTYKLMTNVIMIVVNDKCDNDG